MGLDTLFLIKTRDREFRMGGKYMAYDCFYAPAAIDLFNLLDAGVLNPAELEQKNQFGLVACSWESDDWKPDVVIDCIERKIKLPMINLQHAEDFEAFWGAKIISNKIGTFVDWGNGDVEPLIKATDQIDKIYQFTKKEFLTIDELKEYNSFIEWCGEQESTTFEYRDSLVYHYQPA